MKRKKILATMLFSVITCVLFSGSGHAENAFRKPDGLLDNSPKTRQHMISAFGFVPWWYGAGFGLAGRYAIPIVDDGFIPRLNDSVELEFGIDTYYARWRKSGYYRLVFPVEGRWTFHITPKFSAYGKAALGFGFFSANDSNIDLSYIHWGLSSGILYKFHESIAFRAELGVSGLLAGVGFSL